MGKLPGVVELPPPGKGAAAWKADTLDARAVPAKRVES
jgi:hypothetical protein